LSKKVLRFYYNAQERFGASKGMKIQHAPVDTLGIAGHEKRCRRISFGQVAYDRFEPIGRLRPDRTIVAKTLCEMSLGKTCGGSADSFVRGKAAAK